MKDIYVEGYSNEAFYCPFCGSGVDTSHADGSNDCSVCGKKFIVIEDD